MIGRISGELIEKKPPYLLVDVQGIGYEIQAPMTTIFRLPGLGARVTLHTHFSVTETSQQLFGFANQQERDLFRLLIKVNGVGPKMAVGILSMEADEFVACVNSENLAALVKIPGVGKKTAERLLIEMADKLKAWGPTSGDLLSVTPGPGTQTQDYLADAESALIALGYKPAEAAKVLAKVDVSMANSSEDYIRAALKLMMPV